MRSKPASLPTLLALTLLLAIAPGCKTLTPGQQDTLADAADAVRTTADGVVTLAIANDPDNRAIIQATVTALDQLLLATSYEPAKVEAALTPIWKRLKDPNVAFGMRTVLTAYQVAVRRWVVGTIDGNQVARTLLTALRDGANAALSFPAGRTRL